MSRASSSRSGIDLGRIDTKVYNTLAAIRAEANRVDEQFVNEYIESHNISNLVSPYWPNPTGRRVLEYILGSPNVNKIATMNALAHTGILNTRCPPPYAPERTEAYINPTTNKLECREPTKIRKPYPTLKNPEGKLMKCPTMNNDPMATQTYVDIYGNQHCIRPILSGPTSCPPANQPTHTKLVVMKDGTSTCIPDPKVSANKYRVPIGNDLLFPDDVNERVINYINDFRVYLRGNDTYRLEKLASMVKNKRTLDDLKSGLSNNPEYEALVSMVNNIKSEQAYNDWKTALVWFMEKDGKMQLTTQDTLDIMGLTPQDFQTGGRKKKK